VALKESQLPDLEKRVDGWKKKLKLHQVARARKITPKLKNNSPLISKVYFQRGILRRNFEMYCTEISYVKATIFNF